MPATVELSNKPCHFCGKTGENYKAKIKSQELQAVLCDEHLRQVLSAETTGPAKPTKNAATTKAPAAER